HRLSAAARDVAQRHPQQDAVDRREQQERENDGADRTGHVTGDRGGRDAEDISHAFPPHSWGGGRRPEGLQLGPRSSPFMGRWREAPEGLELRSSAVVSDMIRPSRIRISRLARAPTSSEWVTHTKVWSFCLFSSTISSMIPA